MSSSEEETSPVKARGFKAHMENKEKQLLITRQGFSSSESTSSVLRPSQLHPCPPPFSK